MPKKGLPSVVSPIPKDLRRFIDRLREIVDRDGTIVSDASSSTGTNAGGGAGGTPDNSLSPGGLGGQTACVTPPPPTELVAIGTMTSILLSWKGADYNPECHALTEIYRSADSNFGNAILIASTSASVFSDPVGRQASFHYWVRFVNVNGVQGPLNSGTSTPGSTAPDIAYLMSMLVEEFGSDSESPFFQIDAPTVINGVTVPPGTYMKTAFILDGSIDTAKIGQAAITTALIQEGAIIDALIEDGAITNAKIKDTIESADNGITWKIDKFGGITARAVRLMNADGSVLLESNQGIDWNNIVGAGRPQNGADKTSENIAAAIINQSPFAANLDKIDATNISTYIAAGAIDTAFIRDAAIDSAKIREGSIRVLNLLDGQVMTGSQMIQNLGEYQEFDQRNVFYDLATMIFSAHQPMRNITAFSKATIIGDSRASFNMGGFPDPTVRFNTGANAQWYLTWEPLGAINQNTLDFHESSFPGMVRYIKSPFAPSVSSQNFNLGGVANPVPADDMWSIDIPPNSWPATSEAYGLYGLRVKFRARYIGSAKSAPQYDSFGGVSSVQLIGFAGI